MRRYHRIVTTLYAVIFTAGGLSHFVLGRWQPDSYAGFGHTAIFAWLSDQWAGWVMPNIGWLTLLLAVFEIACGVAVTRRRTATWAVFAMIGFLVFITVIGYGFPTTSPGEDFLKNRAITIAMVFLLIPLLTRTGRQAATPVISPPATGQPGGNDSQS